ncbi:hypothetical protein [uncultured Sphingomonas sp.]|uniref:hypothetical protein n=1 Tax=uncultured Sphingomonas sp. TaxID=158754 RepID=UPI0035CC5A24
MSSAARHVAMEGVRRHLYEAGDGPSSDSGKGQIADCMFGELDRLSNGEKPSITSPIRGER